MSILDIFKRSSESLFESQYKQYGGVVVDKGLPEWKWLIAFDEDNDRRVLDVWNAIKNERWVDFVYALHEHEGILSVGICRDAFGLEMDFDFRFPDSVGAPDDWWSVQTEMMTYEQRDAISKLCGLTVRERPEPTTQPARVDYKEYIASDAWKRKSEDAKRRAGYHCQVCNSTQNLNTHHRTYDHLGNEPDEDLTVLCRDCHELFSKQGKLAK